MKIFIIFFKLVSYVITGIFLVSVFIISISYFIEAVTQKEFILNKSKGDCRIVNMRLAYDNNYILYVDKLIKKENQNYLSLYHVYTVDKLNIVHDKSKNNTIDGLKYEDFIKKQDFNDRIFTAEFKDGKLENIKIIDGYNINAYYQYLNTIIHYFVYKKF